MATFRQSPVNRFLLRLIPRGHGEVRAIQDARRLRDVVRFSAVFSITILGPALLLAYFAFSSIQSEQLQVDDDLRARAVAIESQVVQELEGTFRRFEQQAAARLITGGSPLDQLSEISPLLRFTARVDPNGDLRAPFVFGESRNLPVPSARYRAAREAAISAERDKDYPTATKHWAKAVQHATGEPLLAEARWGEIRTQSHVLDPREAEQRLADLIADHAVTRDRHGFRMGDLAKLRRSQLRMAADPLVGGGVIQDFVKELLDERWTIGETGEITVARRALAQLSGHADTDWIARTRTRLSERADQLLWAGLVADELALYSTRRIPDDEFRYFASKDSIALWSAVRHRGDLYLFSFTQAGLIAKLGAITEAASDSDPALQASLMETASEAGPGVILSHALGPQLPFVTVVISHADLDALAATKSNLRNARIAVVLISVFLVFVGVILSARLVGNEVENARMKADFAANVSHELRSPITQIRLKAETLQLDLCYDDADRLEHYDAIVREAERLSRLVDNVLDFAAIERGAKRYTLRLDDLLAVVMIQVEAMRPSMEKNGITLQVELPYDLSPVWMDREAVGQVLINLLSNAVKYGGDSKWVGVQVEEREDGVALAISDRGLGISAEELPHLFDDFFRSQDPNVRKQKGTGIGLSIVRYIVEAHGATITVDSEHQQGTTFTIVFPLEPPEGAGGSA